MPLEADPVPSAETKADALHREKACAHLRVAVVIISGIEMRKPYNGGRRQWRLLRETMSRLVISGAMAFLGGAVAVLLPERGRAHAMRRRFAMAWAANHG